MMSVIVWFVLLLVTGASAHLMWLHPAPREANDGIKGPYCGLC